MKAVTFDPNTDRFSINKIPIPEPSPDEVRIRVEACSLNPVDAKIIKWKRQIKTMDSSWVPGLDVSGYVEAVGTEVTMWEPGDQVLYHGNMHKPHGGLAEYAIHRAATLIHHPDVPAKIAATTPCAGWTAFRALTDRLRIDKDSTLLISGASGGVGGFAVQIAKALGVRTIIATCSSENIPYVSELGATHTIDYHHENIVQRVIDITEGNGVTHALDTVGNGAEVPIVDSLAFEGQIVEVASLLRPELYEDAFKKGLTFHQLALGMAHTTPETEHLLVEAGTEFSRLLEEGLITIKRKRIISLSEAPHALEHLLQRSSPDKIIVSL